MKNILLCTSNPILIKSLYGMLRDEGLVVETVEHPAYAVQLVMRKPFDFIIMDSEPFGLSSEDAADIIRLIAPNIQILFLGRDGDHDHSQNDVAPVDLEEIKRAILGIAV